jgi:ABC-type transport system involved in multi-copper enzyme maturation permease subunit
MGRRQIATLARFTVLEAARTRLMWIFIFTLVLVSGAAYFVHQLAITENARMQIAFAAAATRLVAVFVLSMHILTSIVREFNDKGLELTLSFNLRRADYIVGRFAGFMLIAVAMAFVAGLSQSILAPLPAVLQWTSALALELILVAALSVFSILTFTQVMPAASFVAGFYLLGRTITAIQLISAAAAANEETLSEQVTSWIITGLSLVLPALDRFAQSAWLVEAPAGWLAVGACAVASMIYTALLIAAAMFDFYRRNL